MSALQGEGNVGPADDRPLTDQEYQLLQRLLSDPFSIPIQFKTWLVSYLETSDINLPMSAINGLTATLGITGVGSGTLGILPAGIVLPFGGTSAPPSSKMCDGASYSRTTEARLYQAIGTLFGSVDVNSFNVPDIQERIPVGRGALAALNAVGKNDNLPLGSRGIAHRHGFTGTAGSTGTESTTHVHDTALPYGGGATTGGGGPQGAPDTTPRNVTSAGQNIAHTHPFTPQGAVGAAGTPPEGPAFLVLNFIIVS